MSRHRSNTEAAMFPQKCSSARLTKSACVLAELSAVAPVAIAGLAVADPLDASKADYEQCLANDFPHETCCSRQDGRNPRAIHPNMRLFLNANFKLLWVRRWIVVVHGLHWSQFNLAATTAATRAGV